MKLLLIAEESHVLKEIKSYLGEKEEVSTVTTRTSSRAALEQLKGGNYEAIILSAKSGRQTLNAVPSVKEDTDHLFFILFPNEGDSQFTGEAITLKGKENAHTGALTFQYASFAQKIVEAVLHHRRRMQKKDLYALAQALRQVNQLVTQESDFQILFQKAAEALMNVNSCANVSIIYLSEEKKDQPVAYRGTYGRTVWDDISTRDQLPECAKKGLRSTSPTFLTTASQYCDDCNFCDVPAHMQLIILPLLRRSQVNGVLLLFWEATYKISGEEMQLLEDIAKDLAFARSKMKAQEEREIAFAHAKLEAEEAIRKREEKFRQLFEAMPDPTFVVNEEGNITEINAAACTLFGCTEADIVGRSLSELSILSPTSRKKIMDDCKRTINGEKLGSSPYPLEIKKGGVKRYLEVNSAPLKDYGSPRGVIEIARDITPRKKAEKKLEVLHEWAQRLNRAKNMEEIIEHTLKAIEKTLGFKFVTFLLKEDDALEVAAYRGFETYPPTKRQLPLHGKSVVVQAAEKGKSININDVKNCSDYRSSLEPVKSELAVPIKIEGHIIGVLAVESDETGRFDRKDKHLLEILASHVAVAIKELQEKQERVSLERVDKLRDQFIAMVAHELGAPLTSIQMELEMLDQGFKGELTNEQKSGVKSALDNVNRLTRLSKDFQRISKLRVERGRMPLSPTAIQGVRWEGTSVNWW